MLAFHQPIWAAQFCMMVRQGILSRHCCQCLHSLRRIDGGAAAVPPAMWKTRWCPCRCRLSHMACVQSAQQTDTALCLQVQEALLKVHWGLDILALHPCRAEMSGDALVWQGQWSCLAAAVGAHRSADLRAYVGSIAQLGMRNSRSQAVVEATEQACAVQGSRIQVSMPATASRWCCITEHTSVVQGPE